MVNPDQTCSSDQWSMLASSAGISQLAGVLGGFLITAIALLFDRKGRESVHTLALFSTAVLVLMLASFVLSIMTGTVVPDDGERRGAGGGEEGQVQRRGVHGALTSARPVGAPR